ncbi:hypothetical protein Tco_0255318 [Tanacetum coccineum]
MVDTLESSYSRFTMMMSRACPKSVSRWLLIDQVNVRFLLQLNHEWQRFFCEHLLRRVQELKNVSAIKMLYDIKKLKHQNEVNEIRMKRLARTANPLQLVASKQQTALTIHTKNHPTQNLNILHHDTEMSYIETRKSQLLPSCAPTYDPEPATVMKMRNVKG